MYKNNLWKDQYGIRAPFSNKSRVYYTIIIWLMRHNTMNARMKMWQGYTDCMTWNVNKRKQTAGGWERAGGHRLATVRGLRLWLCLDWLITELICIFFNFKQTTNFSTIHLQNVIHQSGCGRTSVKNLLEFWDRLYTRLAPFPGAVLQQNWEQNQQLRRDMPDDCQTQKNLVKIKENKPAVLA